MRSLSKAIPMTCALALVLAGGPSTPAADIDDLGQIYLGPIHHTTTPLFEVGDAFLAIDSKQANGAFSGEFAGIAIRGKVTQNGKVTFSGRDEEDPREQIRAGKAQLSATGRFLVGSFTYVEPGNPAAGKFIFSLSTDSL